MRAIPVGAAPVIDGKLDDQAWLHADFVSDFLQKEPIEGGVPSQRTEVAIVYDAEALYVGARMYAGGRADIQAVMTRRDDTGTAERIIVSLDTFRNRRTAYSFAVTAAGVRADWFHPDDAEFARDHSFDPVWTAETTLGAEGWFAEMRIPFTQLRFTRGDEQRWGININRYIPHRNEDIFWVPVPKDATAWSSHFGELYGLHEIRQPLRVEIVPYLVGNMTLTSSALIAADDPFADTLAMGGRAGVDIKVGLGPSLTLDAAINPDFGQVEADPAEVNLSGFETFFGERRPFFTEGRELLAGKGKAYYYSRRIGARPRGSAEGDYVYRPESTALLGAAKLTGRLPSALSIGALAAVTGQAHADTYDTATDSRERVRIEPLATYGVLRVQQEFGRSASIVGASLAGVHRDLDAGEPLAAELVRQSLGGGVDWSLRSAGATYELSGNAGFTLLRGEPAAILARMQTPVHYFQRPDQDHVSLDGDRRSLSGLTGELWLSKRNGSWLWNLGVNAEGPGFDPNDVGQLQSSDDLGAHAQVMYRDSAPGARLHAWQLGAGAGNEWNFSGARDPGYMETFGALVLKNFWNLSAISVLFTPGVSDHATRGGPLTGIGWGGGSEVVLQSPYSARHRWSVSAAYEHQQTGTRGMRIGAGATMRLADWASLSFTPSYRRLSHNRQYIDTCGDHPDDACMIGNPDTYGARYIFATVDRRELSVQTRLQFAFTPNLALDMYVEPFASSGRFYRFGELPAPGSRDLAIYGQDVGMIERIDPAQAPQPCLQGCVYRVTEGGETFTFVDPDFTYLSLRSTAVLRWEIWPGSALFVIWAQDRADALGAPGLVTPITLGEATIAPGSHTLLIKFAYWWSADRAISRLAR
jgi:hypothetical protein